jgi:hypothetical protein
MDNIIVIGIGPIGSAQLRTLEIVGKLDGAEIEIIHVENLNELKEKGIVGDLVISNEPIMELRSLPPLPVINISDYNFFTDSRKSRYQKREFRKPATPIKKRKK